MKKSFITSGPGLFLTVTKLVNMTHSGPFDLVYIGDPCFNILAIHYF